MPDPTKQTVSATQVAALFDESPYCTRFTLYHDFIGDGPDDDREDSRMSWGKKLQPLLLATAAEDLHLEVTPNEGDDYVRSIHAHVGCTRDAVIHCPDRGPGALECKCVFDYRQWMNRWNGGRVLPRDIDLQLQVQMLVGDGETSYDWGVIAIWLCGEMQYHERSPIPKLWDEIRARADDFLATVNMKEEPDPFGSPVEDAYIARLFPQVKDEALELDDYDLGEKARMYAWARDQERLGKKTAQQIKPILLNAAGTHNRVKLPGAILNISKSNTKAHTVEYKAGVRTVLKAVKVDEGYDDDPIRVVEGGK